jgi:hypothetical protein
MSISRRSLAHGANLEVVSLVFLNDLGCGSTLFSVGSGRATMHAWASNPAVVCGKVRQNDVRHTTSRLRPAWTVSAGKANDRIYSPPTATAKCRRNGSSLAVPEHRTAARPAGGGGPYTRRARSRWVGTAICTARLIRQRVGPSGDYRDRQARRDDKCRRWLLYCEMPGSAGARLWDGRVRRTLRRRRRSLDRPARRRTIRTKSTGPGPAPEAITGFAVRG